MRAFILSQIIFIGAMLSFPSLASSVQIAACDTDACRKKFKEYRKYARNGSPEAQMVLAGMFYSGYGVERSSKQSLRWYRLAGRQTSLSFAKLRAGLLFLYDKDIEQNIEKGVELLEKAANGSSIEAANRLANLYIQGELVEKNLPEAEKWLLVASELGDDSSQYRLGLIYEAGMLGEKQLEKAIELYQKSALKNNVQASERLSLLGVTKAKEDVFASTKDDNIERIAVTAPDLSSLLDISLTAIRDTGQYGKRQSCTRLIGARCRGHISITDKDDIDYRMNGR